uniref:DUF5899 domain-containing protein n=1 Tax=viral metagenome TaxID=1070528 RepID=A0A6C0I3W9_9ZZZZ
MEVLIPAVALGGLYMINNQSKTNESFTNKRTTSLPNTNIPNRNYPEEFPVVSSDTDQTSELSRNNRYDSGVNGVYTDKYFNPSAQEPTNSSQQYYALTGNKVDGSYFEHNNMVPYFGSNMRTRISNEDKSEGVLDAYSGAGSQYITKSEQSPMFKPTDNQQWAHGAPNMSDFFQSRVNPSMSMSNVKPFEEEMVGPGLGQGYGTAGAGGFNSGMLARDTWLPKTADQMRVDNKPKATGMGILGYEGPANSAIKQNATVEQMGIMEKHLPEQSFEWGHDRLFTTTGLEKGQTMHSMPVDRYVSRPETAVEYAGIAGSYLPESYVQGEYMPTHNQQLGSLPFAGANANGRNYATDADYESRSRVAYPNNRTVNKQDNYFGMVSGSLGAVVAPLLDALRPSRRQNVIGSLRPYQNPGTRVSESYIFNPADRLPTTIRETTEGSKYHHNINTNQLGGAYKVTDHEAKHTYRQDTSVSYGGVATAKDKLGGAYKVTDHDAKHTYRQDTSVSYGGVATAKDKLGGAYKVTDHDAKHTYRQDTSVSYGGVATAKDKLGGAYKVTDHDAKHTYRQDTSVSYGGVATAKDKLGGAYKVTDHDAKHTYRQDTSVSYGGGASATDKLGGAYKVTDHEAKRTYRQDSSVFYAGGAGATDQLSGAYHVTEHDAPHTYRQDTSDFFYAGGASAPASTRQTKSYEAVYNQRNNEVKQGLLNGHTPKGGMALLNSDVNVRQSTRDHELMNNRAVIGDMPYQSPGPESMGRVAGNTNELYSGIHMDRNSPEIMDALQGNPFVVNYKNGL